MSYLTISQRLFVQQVCCLGSLSLLTKNFISDIEAYRICYCSTPFVCVFASRAEIDFRFDDKFISKSNNR